VRFFLPFSFTFEPGLFNLWWLSLFRANVDYLHQNIVECQQNIVEMEAVGASATSGAGAGGENTGDAQAGEDEALAAILDIRDLGADEARYLLAKLLSMTVNQCCQSLQRDAQVRELQNKISQITHQSTLHQQLLQHMIEQQDLEIYDLMLANEHDEDDDDADDSSEEESPPPPMSKNNGVHLSLNVVAGLQEDAPTSDSSTGRRDKARSKRTTKEDLLFNDTDVPQPTVLTEALLSPAKRTATSFARSLSFTKQPGQDLMFRSRSFVKPSGGGFGYGMGGRGRGLTNGRPGLAPLYQQPLASNNIMTQSMVDPTSASRLYQPSPLFSRRTLERQQQQQQQAAPGGLRSSMRKVSSTARLSSQDAESSSSPPGSPPVFRRSGSVRAGDDGRNVFHRLVAGTRIGESTGLPGKGNIHPFQGRVTPRAPLICSSVAEGHTRAVLSVFANDDLLLTGSKDRTVKVWDLHRKEEIASLAGHPNNVSVVKYSEAMRLAFSVSTAFIKVWDLRTDTSAGCIKTLSSSGLTTTGPVQPAGAALPGSRTLQLPAGETLVNDIALAPSGHSLFSAAGDKVRVWDLRKFHSIGKLSGGHNAAVMCLASGVGPGQDGDYVVTGSKDHYVKVFRVAEGRGGVVTPSANLDPPHYDGVQCLALRDDVLFSASRDTCIKKWDLAAGGELVRSLNNAHKDWICGLAFLPGGNTLISGCRAGHLRLWDATSCAQTGEMKAHNSTINAIAVNNSLVFTGSNDGSVGLWRVRRDFDRSPDSDSAS
jgi:WD40 repeat protein